MFDNIVAISSGNINQPISIIRISGPEAFEIVKKIFSGKVGKDKTISYGYIFDSNNEKVDEVLVSSFVAPHTFTGENIIEINAHGGVINTNKILKLILANGARLATKGEFSRRAFLNGKMDLVKAESIHELIFAKTEEQAKLAIKKFDGKTSKLINKIINQILYVIATIEINIDYPEYDDIEQLSTQTLLPKLLEIQKNLELIKKSSVQSRMIFEGINVAIVGQPNVGKSSLLNVLLSEDKAIVSNIPGTTRDVVEGSIQINQVLFNFKDTAGIHSTNNQIENQGIKKSLNKIQEADFIIHLLEQKDNYKDKEYKNILNAIGNKKYIEVFNKSDLIKEKQKDKIYISAKDKNIDQLIKKIEKEYKEIDLNNDAILNNVRQLSLIDSALLSINESISSLEEKLTPDTVIIDINKAWEDLSNILGKVNQEDLLDSMFSNFCLGK